jgi:hypothetical protein
MPTNAKNTMRPRTFPTIRREDYEASIKRGDQWRDAGLYEPDHAPRNAEFFFVQLTPDYKVLRRRFTRR